MVASAPSLGLIVVFKHREIDYPKWTPIIFKELIGLGKIGMTNFHPQSAEGIVNHLGFVSPEKQDIAVCCMTAREQSVNCSVMEIFHNR